MTEYKLQRRRRQKSLRMHFVSDGTLVVSAPLYFPLWKINQFVDSHEEWIEKHRPNLQNKPVFSENELYDSAICKCAYWMEKLDIPFRNDVIIKLSNAKSYWGVCYPEKRLIKLSRRCCFLNDSQLDYVVLHEVCHFVYCNHSPEFWNLVETDMK